jgi:N-acetylglutamate synthase-like GNAT family acetyltransferase
MSDPNTTWKVRPPWPDELPRLERNFQIPSLQIGAQVPVRRWVIEASEPERIVGMAALKKTEEQPDDVKQKTGVLRFAWEVRPSWFTHSAAEALLETVLNAANEIAAKAVITSAENDGWIEKILLARGFQEVSRKQIWNINVEMAMVPLMGKLSRMLLRSPVEVTNVDVTNLKPIRKICAHYKLLTPELVVPVSLQVPTGFDPRFSFVAGDPDNPLAILMGRESKGRAYLEILARNAEHQEESPTAIIGLLREFFLAAQRIGYKEVSCLFLFEQDSGILSLIRRFGAIREDSISQFMLTL